MSSFFKLKPLSSTDIIVVILILTIFMGFLVPEQKIKKWVTKLDMQKIHLDQINKAIEQFRSDNGRYPNDLSELIATKNSKPYLYEIPVDPITGMDDWEIREKEPSTKWYINPKISKPYNGAPANK